MGIGRSCLWRKPKKPVKKTVCKPARKKVQRTVEIAIERPGKAVQVVQSVPTKSQVQPAPSESQVQPVPSESQIQPVPSESLIQPVPSESQVQPVPSESQVQPVPTKSTVQRETSRPLSDKTAQEDKDKSVVELLLELGGMPDIEDDHGFAPLHISVERNDLEVITKFIRSGANIRKNYSRFRGETILHFSIDHAKYETIEHLLKLGGDVNAVDMDGVTPLRKALMMNNLKILSLFLRKGADFKSCDATGKSILHFAVQGNKVEAVGMILGHGADPEVRTIDGWSPLHMACWLGHVAVAEVLLKNGADVTAETNTGEVPLHLAAAKGNSIVVQRLLAYNADVNKRDKLGRTPLLHAIENQIGDMSRAYNLVIAREMKDTIDLLILHGGVIDVWTTIPIQFG